MGKASESLSNEIKKSNDQMCSLGSGEVIEKRYRQRLNYKLPGRGYQNPSVEL